MICPICYSFTLLLLHLLLLTEFTIITKPNVWSCDHHVIVMKGPDWKRVFHFSEPRTPDHRGFVTVCTNVSTLSTLCISHLSQHPQDLHPYLTWARQLHFCQVFSFAFISTSLPILSTCYNYYMICSVVFSSLKLGPV